MSINPKSFALASIVSLVALSGTAIAGSDFTARFDYSLDAPISQTYARFEKTARDVCKLDRVKAGGVGTMRKMENACTAQLLSDAVAETRIPALVAYHAEQTGQMPALPQYAEAE
ncbi:MAG: hypothetical protein CMK09_17495 [Ponticaulis sp.]|nr:hypothetical protein [Ponticaulis sp.]|tara:strand:- start:44113 stop:44457 length:345 start_codon:yes stop_codon:yes gene_type:complete